MNLAPASNKLLNDFCAEIVVFSNQIKRAAFDSPAADSVLSVGKAVLELLSLRGAMTVPAIAASRSSSRQNAQIIVNRLLRMGFVTIQPNPEHKRSSLISITENGREAVSQATKQDSALITNLSQHFSEKELERSLELISRLRRVLDGEEKVSKKMQGHARKRPSPDSTRQADADQAMHDPMEEQAHQGSIGPDPVPDADENSLPYNLL
jgi:DNA-binding MarR family transcriptional regulator